MKWLEWVNDLDKGSNALQIAVQAISEPIDSHCSVNPNPDLNIRLFHDNESHIIAFALEGESQKPGSVHPGFLISPGSGFRKVAGILVEKPFILILEEERTERIICWQDLNRPPVVAWLFSQISFLETMLKLHVAFALGTMELTQSLSWRKLIPSSQLEKVDEVLKNLENQDADTHFLDALTFMQLSSLIRRLYKFDFGIPNWSKDALKASLWRANNLRNATAHARRHLKAKSELLEFVKALEELASLNEALAIQMDFLEGLQVTRYRLAKSNVIFTVGDVIPQGATSICFISAWNPCSDQLALDENSRRNKSLEHTLLKAELNFELGEAFDPLGKWPTEVSFCVYDADFKVVHSIAREFNQRTIAWADLNTPFRICLVASA